MRNRRGQIVDGWLLIDKPLEKTSAFIVNKVKYAFDARKVGHSGTLDPLATGLLPIAFGKATKTIPYILDKKKVYHFTLTFGESRTTDDAEGEVLARSDVRPSDEEINKALEQFQGEILQVPPIFSAIKVDGRRSYDLARQGEVPELKKRPARIDSFRLIERLDRDRAKFEVISGKGVYMRSLARDLAVACQSVGYISELRRLKVGPFDVTDAFLLDKIVGNDKKGEASLDLILPVETALDDIPALALTSDEVAELSFGRVLERDQVADRVSQYSDIPDGVVRAVDGKRFVGLCRLDTEWLRPIRIF
ncbi:tRNA pseudouridine synthase B [Commensalibacter intestini A911]|uniref:tRNA pseudouridine synthase B n=2 Tax=Commensalibacter intestini TaxID=479936 RepID=A0A251ZTP1_9PROT|nr:tRNA pseudouridine(55) synthase TruB [Commensalibacter intestini]EHD13549.1 tRNA pseudouridine synthase B [Commensalibacter intestini A911]OUI78033.1 pseudouridine synthase [Commensalibacter intestini]